MRYGTPPSLAAWMLEHLMPGEANDALAGDLAEEYSAGRTASWYWRQVLSAITIRGLRELRFRRGALFFAALWSMLAPVWLLAVAGLEQAAHLSRHLSGMMWPWSTVCDLGLMLTASLLFLWAGILLYLFSELWLVGKLRLRELARGIADSLPALLVLWLALTVLPRHFVAVHTTMQISAPSTPTPLQAFLLDRRRRVLNMHTGPASAQELHVESGSTVATDVNRRNAFIDMSTPAMLARLPFFLVVLCALWPAAARMRRCAS